MQSKDQVLTAGIQMHKTCIHGIEGMGSLSLLTFHGVLLGPWDLSWETGDREVATSERLGLHPVFHSWISLQLHLGWRENSLEITLYPLCFSLEWVRVREPGRRN